MEPPEDGFDLGLTWPKFKSIYSSVRKGANSTEVSAAWTRYKTRIVSKKSPKKSKKETINLGPVTLGTMPGDVLRVIAAQRSGAAGVLAQLSKTTHGYTKDIVTNFCEKDIGRIEMYNSIIRVLKQKRLQEHPAQDKIFFSYMLLGNKTVFRHIYEITYFSDSNKLEVKDTGYGFRIERNSVRILDTTANFNYFLDDKAEEYIANVILLLMDKEVLNWSATVFQSRETIREILSHRGKCNVDWNTVTDYARVRMVRILHGFNNPILNEYLGRREWTNRREMILSLLGQETRIIIVTIILLGRWDNDRNVITDIRNRVGQVLSVELAHDVSLGLTSIGRVLGITLIGNQ